VHKDGEVTYGHNDAPFLHISHHPWTFRQQLRGRTHALAVAGRAPLCRPQAPRVHEGERAEDSRIVHLHKHKQKYLLFSLRFER